MGTPSSQVGGTPGKSRTRSEGGACLRLPKTNRPKRQLHTAEKFVAHGSEISMLSVFDLMRLRQLAPAKLASRWNFLVLARCSACWRIRFSTFAKP